jgi:hypothetical protein
MEHNKQLEKILQRLEKNKLFETQEMVFNFEDAVRDLVDLNDPKHIPILLNYLDDDCEFIGTMYTIIQGIENYGLIEYVQGVLPYLGSLNERAPEWAKSLVYGILNHPDMLCFFKEKILPYAAQVEPILQDIYHCSPNHQEVCVELLKTLGKYPTV